MDIIAYYTSLLEQFRSVKYAEQELRRQMDDDPELAKSFSAWCAENELEPRHALREFGEQYMDEQAERWEALNDYDNIE